MGIGSAVFDVSRRPHYAFARDDRHVESFLRVTTYFLHFPTEERAAAAEAACRAIDAAVGTDFPLSGDSGPKRALAWRLNVTLPGLAPDPTHSQNEKDLSGLAQEHDGAYAGWQLPRPDEQS